jgi:hypothetical protein
MSSRKEFWELIDNLRGRGPMYVSPYNFDSVSGFLLGYCHAKESVECREFLIAFRSWLQVKYGESNCNWNGILWKEAKEESQEALELLFNCLAEFRRSLAV